MSAKIQFSWNNQKGYGLALTFYGWALIIQFPAFIYSSIILQISASQNDWYLYFGILITLTAIIGSFLGTIFENSFDPLSNQFTNIQTVIIIALSVYYLFFLFSVPFLETIEPFLSIPRKLGLDGWTKFNFSLFAGVVGIFIYWQISERIARNK